MGICPFYSQRFRDYTKESENLDEVMITGIDENSILEYENKRNFKEWVLSLKPKDVKDYGISKMALWKIKNKLKQNKPFNPKTKIAKILIDLCKYKH